LPEAKNAFKNLLAAKRLEINDMTDRKRIKRTRGGQWIGSPELHTRRWEVITEHSGMPWHSNKNHRL
jgi:hypothetical protein